MMKTIAHPTLVIGFLLAALSGPALADHHKKITVLYMGGRGHDSDGYYKSISGQLAKQGDFELVLSNKLDDLKAETIKKYDVVLFFGSGGNFTDPAQEKGLDDYVRGGGGVVGVHATDAFKKSDSYWKMFGGQFVGHGGGKFPIEFTDTTHPITKGMKGFEIEDESYRDKFHPATIDKLHHLGRINRGNEKHSMIWIHEYGKGRLFNTGLGHDQKAWDNPALQKLVIRSLYWAAKKPVKDPKK
jgi:type 1 glutamine amidotransferase